MLRVIITVALVAAGGRQLTLEEVLALADKNNLDLVQALARRAQTETSIASARAALLPTATVQGKYTHNNYSVAVPAGLTPTPIVITPMEQLDASGNLQVPLIVPSAWYQLRSANRSVDAARAGFDVSRAQTLLAVAQYFYQAAGADEVLVARQHGVTVAKKTLDDAVAKVEEGAANKVESDRAQIAYERAVQASIEASAQAEQAYRTLSTAIGESGKYRVVVGASTVDSMGDDFSDTNDLEGIAHKLRPEFVQDDKQIESSRASANASLARWLPTLSAFGQARAFNYAGFSGQSYALAAGVQIDWTLYDGGARDAARHLADAQTDEAEARLALLNLTIAADIANDRRDLEVKRSAVATATRAVTLSQQTLERVRAQHDAGTITQLDLLNAQDTLVSAELTLAQARFDLALADLTLKREVGTFPRRK